MDKIEKDLLLEIADLHEIPQGAYSLRENGKSVEVKSTKNIEIVPKKDKAGIDILVKPNTTNESIHIPVLVTQTGIKDMVYNDFYIGDNADILIVAGCGVHNTGASDSEHNGIHTFHIGKNAKVRYVEKHLGLGNAGGKILNPVTNLELEDNAEMTMETTQLGGVTSSVRTTKATLQSGAKLTIKEKILTTDNQTADTKFNVELVGVDSSVDVVSRSVAKNTSRQSFVSSVTGDNRCFGHVSCDAILIDNSVIISTPEIVAKCADATLVHEAAIGKIAGDQLIKLMTLGLTSDEAENVIIKGFLS